MSRKMMSAELNYDIHNKKLLAIVVAFQIWRVYIEDLTKITIFIDHKNLTNFCIIEELNKK